MNPSQYEEQFKKLTDIGTVGRGKSKHRPRNDPDLYGGQYPFVQTGDIKHSNCYLTSYTQTYNEKGLAQSKLWPPGTLCITIAANIADTAILGIPACFPDSIIGFTPKKGVSDVRFVKYCLDTYKQQMRSISQGTTQDNLSQEKLLSIRFRTPSFAVQEKIAAILSAYDDLIENNRRRIALLEKMAEEIYREWFVRMRFPGHEQAKFEKGVPEGWKQMLIGNLLKRISPGKKYEEKTSATSGNVPILDQGQSGIIGYHNDEPGVVASPEKPVIVFANHTCYQRLIFFPFSAIQNVLPFIPSTTIKSNIFWLHMATKGAVELSEYKGHWPAFVTTQIYFCVFYPS